MFVPLAFAVLVGGWVASCSYMKLCLDESNPLVEGGRVHNPSLLTDVLPELIMSAFGLLFL